MKIYLMTDLEGVAGVLNYEDWCTLDSRYYETARRFLTAEVNAAVDGFFAGGATQIMVVDGHFCDGLNQELLDSRVELLKGWYGYPMFLDQGDFDAVAWVGQHAKASSEYAHIAHTQAFNYIDLSINGVSIGELGQLAMCASELGIRSIFAAGDEALTKEAQTLIPGIETVSVKRGTVSGTGEDLTVEAYMRRNYPSIHMAPTKANALIRAGAKRAVERALKKDFGIIDLKPPYEKTIIYRPNQEGEPKTISTACHPTSVAALMNIYNPPEPLA
jgi:D-amino peptidase